jgi:hypothetical protein
MAARVMTRQAEIGTTIASGLAWGAAMGGIQRVKPVATTVLCFAGAIGGLIGAMTVKEPIAANMLEGVAAGSAAIFGLGLAAPVAGVGAPAKGPTELLLKAGRAARLARIGAGGVGAGRAVAGRAVGEYIQEEQILS